MLLVSGLLALSSSRHESITFDELGHLTGGFTSWTLSDFRMFPQNGQFPQRWGTLPLVFQDTRLPSTDQPAWRHSHVDEFGDQFLFTAGNDSHAMLRSSRTMMLVLGVLLQLIVYVWARRLFGAAGANVSLALCAFSPTILANAPLVTSDVAAALGFTLSLYFAWAVLHRITIGHVLGCGGAVGLLCISKMSGFIILPVIAVLVTLRLLRGLPLILALGGYRRVFRGIPGQFACLAAALLFAFGIAWLIIWASYGFRDATFRESSPRDQMFHGQTIETLTDVGPAGTLIRFARNVHLLPDPYLFGIAHVLSSTRGHPAFFHGNYSVRGWKSFLPTTVLLKTPLPVFAIVGLSSLAVASRVLAGDPGGRRPRARRETYRLAPLWVFLAFYWAVTFRVPLSIGHRHVLPTYPAMFILCGAAAHWFDVRHRLRLLVLGMLLWAIVESCVIWPHYLAYFNQLIGGPRNAYRYFVDSSLDWGQDLPGLSEWLARHRRSGHGDIPVYLAYFGTGDPAAYGIDVHLLPGYLRRERFRTARHLTPGVYCISATVLQSVYTSAWGPWNPYYEHLYRERRALFLDGRNDDAPARWNAEHLQRWREFESLRLARLCAYLRQREPDDHIGYSILIYDVSEADLQSALGVNSMPADPAASQSRRDGPDSIAG